MRRIWKWRPSLNSPRITPRVMQTEVRISTNVFVFGSFENGHQCIMAGKVGQVSRVRSSATTQRSWWATRSARTTGAPLPGSSLSTTARVDRAITSSEVPWPDESLGKELHYHRGDSGKWLDWPGENVNLVGDIARKWWFSGEKWWNFDWKMLIV